MTLPAPRGPRRATQARLRKDHRRRLVGRLAQRDLPGLAPRRHRSGALRRNAQHPHGHAVARDLGALEQHAAHLVGVRRLRRAQQPDQRRQWVADVHPVASEHVEEVAVGPRARDGVGRLQVQAHEPLPEAEREPLDVRVGERRAGGERGDLDASRAPRQPVQDQVPHAPRRVHERGAREGERDRGAPGHGRERVEHAVGLVGLRTAGEVAGGGEDAHRDQEPEGPLHHVRPAAGVTDRPHTRAFVTCHV